MLNVHKMIQSAKEALGWPYVSPGTNDKNGIDCSGLYVKMYKDQGKKIYHGSNTIYHDYCSQTGKINGTAGLVPGMAAFKCKEWTDDDRSNKWYGHEPGNISHIGIVVSVNPLEIIHASSVSGMVVTDYKIGKWAYWGRLKDVDYGSSSVAPAASSEPASDWLGDDVGSTDTQLVTAVVTASTGRTVKMRASASRKCDLYDDVPIGSVVTVVKKGDLWTKIDYGKRSGWYMMTEFLDFGAGSVIDNPTTEPIRGVTVTIGNLTEAEAEMLIQKYPQGKKSYG